MKTKSIKKAAIVVSVIFFIGFATYAMAGRGGYGNMNGNGYGQMGYGNGYHMGNNGQMGYSNGYHMGFNGQMGYGNGYNMGINGNHMWDQLTDAQRDQMIKDMDRFHNNFNGNRSFQNDSENNKKSSR